MKPETRRVSPSCAALYRSALKIAISRRNATGQEDFLNGGFTCANGAKVARISEKTYNREQSPESDDRFFRAGGLG